MDLVIRAATPDDVEPIRQIYNHYVECSTCTFQIKPDTQADRLAWFHNRTAAHPVTVAVSADAVVGWAALSPWKPREAYARSTEVSVYVRHDLHRRGIGKALLLDLIERARTLGHHVLIGGTCSEHTGSLALQEALQFQLVGRFREVGFKFERWLDVVYMQFLL